MICTPCSRATNNSQPRPAVAIWVHRNDEHPVIDYVCQSTLDNWLDNADKDPALEPVYVEWFDGRKLSSRGEASR